MFSIMLFIFLCFLGMLAVLFHMLRSQERLCRILRDEHAQMRVLLRAIRAGRRSPPQIPRWICILIRSRTTPQTPADSAAAQPDRPKLPLAAAR